MRGGLIVTTVAESGSEVGVGKLCFGGGFGVGVGGGGGGGFGGGFGGGEGGGERLVFAIVERFQNIQERTQQKFSAFEWAEPLSSR